MVETRAVRALKRSANWSRAAALALLTPLALAASAQTSPSYFEFGTVVALGRQTVDIQTFDPQRQRLVQHSFALTRDTHADIVHVGDDVEVVFTPNANDWTLRRLIVLPAGVPLAGPPPTYPSETASATPPPRPVAPAAVPQPAPAALPAAAPTSSAKPTKTHKNTRPLPTPLPAPKPPVPTAVTATSPATKTKPPAAVVPVELGSPTEAAARLAAKKTHSVDIERPAEECNRSSADWPQQPLRIAVLDFRYPTEREEAHDIGTTGGGSGTAVADLVFARLEQLEQTDDRFLFSRGDRRRLDRSDFAGAARIGRQLGVDAVLAGTFVPVANPSPAADDPSAPKSYELRAGIVDTCTGQLLLQTSSVTCAGGVEPGITAGANPATCTRLATSPKETEDPKAHARAFKPLLDDLLFPIEHNGMPATQPGSAIVSSATANGVTLQLPPHSPVKPGDQLAIHASRLAKNPTTYTLRNLQNEEIGRLSVQSIQGATAHGVYQGDYPPHIGDTAEPVTP
jgi:hypothetical protein